MKKTKAVLGTISLILLFAMTMNLVGCATNAKAEDLMEDVTPNKVTALDDLSGQNVSATDFSLRLFRQANASGENTLLSPLSVLYALAMTANGANGQTREQIEAVLGMSAEELNLYLYSYMEALPRGPKYKLRLANSIWFRDDADHFTVHQDFLQKNADYYDADLYKTPFNKRTLNEINEWVKDETNDMIPKILEEIPNNALMYLINALAFEAEWSDPYDKTMVRDGIFTKEDGTKQDVEMMYSTENYYLEDEKATGFMKHYEDLKYAFVALLPNEGVSVSEYLNSLSGESLHALLDEAEATTVEAALPKFKTEYSTELSEILQAMGMTDAFDAEYADFSGIGSSTEGSLYIGRVIHKTYIEVGEKGTRAGAATAVAMGNGGIFSPEEIKQVYLDRPFVYMLIDRENKIPFFIGTLMDVAE